MGLEEQSCCWAGHDLRNLIHRLVVVVRGVRRDRQHLDVDASVLYELQRLCDAYEVSLLVLGYEDQICSW